MPLTPARYTRLLLVAFAMVALAFVTSTLFQLRSIDETERAQAVAENAAPSLRHIARARTHLHEIAYSGVAWAVQPSRSPSTLSTRMHSELTIVISELALEMNAPPFPDEPPVLAEATAAAHDLTVAVAQTRQLLDEGHDGSEAKALELFGTDVMAGAHRLDAALTELAEINAAHAVRLSQEMITSRKRATVAALAADLGAVLVTIAAAVAGILMFRRLHGLTLEHEHLQAARSAELEAFAGRVAHDLMSPLSGVSMAVSLALRSGQADPKVERVLGSAVRSIGRVRSLIDGLLEFARSGAQVDRQARTRLETTIEGVVEDAKGSLDGKHIELLVGEVPDVEVCCAPGVLMSILSNLVGNAVKYCGSSETKRVVIAARSEGAFVRCTVRDSGPGLPAGEEANIFLPFVRGKHRDLPGLGLGLATVKKLVDAHGGTVGVENLPEGGSSFWFRLPASPAEADETTESLGSARLRRA